MLATILHHPPVHEIVARLRLRQLFFTARSGSAAPPPKSPASKPPTQAPSDQLFRASASQLRFVSHGLPAFDPRTRISNSQIASHKSPIPSLQIDTRPQTHFAVTRTKQTTAMPPNRYILRVALSAPRNLAPPEKSSLQQASCIFVGRRFTSGISPLPARRDGFGEATRLRQIQASARQTGKAARLKAPAVKAAATKANEPAGRSSTAIRTSRRYERREMQSGVKPPQSMKSRRGYPPSPNAGFGEATLLRQRRATARHGGENILAGMSKWGGVERQ